MSESIMVKEKVVKEIEIDGAISSVEFQMVDGEPMVPATQAGMYLYDDSNSQRAADKVNKVASRHPDLFEDLKVRRPVKLTGRDGKTREQWAYTKQGLMLLAMKTRSARGHKFCLAAARVMEELLSGAQVAIVPEKTDAVAQSLQEKHENLNRLVTLQQVALSQANQLSDLKSEMTAIQKQIRDDSERDQRILAIVDEKINHQQGIQQGEYGLNRVAREFHVYHKNPRTGEVKGPAGKLIGAIVRDRKFEQKGLARRGVWVDDSTIDEFHGSKGRVRPALYVNQRGMDRLSSILTQYLKKIDGAVQKVETSRCNYYVAWLPPKNHF